jgi:hypothetical protein
VALLALLSGNAAEREVTPELLASLLQERLEAEGMPACVIVGFVGEATRVASACSKEAGTARNMTQATNQGAREIFAEGKDCFFLRVVDAQLVFRRDTEGAIEGVVLHQGGRETPGRRLK